MNPTVLSREQRSCAETEGDFRAPQVRRRQEVLVLWSSRDGFRYTESSSNPRAFAPPFQIEEGELVLGHLLFHTFGVIPSCILLT